MKGIAELLPLVAIVAVFWLLLVRPARARQQRALALRDDLAVGQHVLTTSGLHATVVAVTGDVVELQTSPGVITRWDIGAVGRIVRDDDRDAAGGSDSAAGSPS